MRSIDAASMGCMATDDLRARREAVVRAHMEAENQHDYDTVIGTFAHPRYELMATGQVFDGEDEVRRYFTLSRTPFPDQRNELVSMRSTDDAVIVELDLLGTHEGPLRGHEPTGQDVPQPHGRAVHLRGRW